MILGFQGGALKDRAFILISATTFEENKNAKWVSLFLNATELGLDRVGRKKIVYIEQTD